MRKVNTVKHADKLPKPSPRPTELTLEQALEDALEEARTSNVSPSSIMKTFEGGYVTGDGEVYTAGGITAKPRVSETKAIESTAPTGAEKYLESRLEDPEYAEAHAEAAKALEEPSVAEKPEAKPEVNPQEAPEKTTEEWPPALKTKKEEKSTADDV